MNKGRSITARLIYEPLPKQAAFHNSQAKWRLYAGGFGSGKTLCGAAESIQLSLEHPGNVGLVGRATYPELRDTTRKEVLSFPVEVDKIKSDLEHSPLIASFNKSENTLKFVNGSVIIFRALEDGFDKIKSLNLGWFWIDELTENSEEIWLGLVGRLRMNGVKHRGFGTTNPEGRDWVWKRFIANENPDHFAVHAPSTENVYLPEGYIASLMEQYPDEWVKRYIYGSFDTFEGLVYKDFQDKAPWVIQPFDIPGNWYRFISIDHGYRNPTAILWGAVSPEGRLFIYDEFYSGGKTVYELAEIIRAKSKGQNIRQYVIDPATKQNKGLNSLNTIFGEFEQAGIYCIPAFNQVGAGINRVQEYFKLQPDGKPRIQIFNNCTNGRVELQTYRWKDLKPGAVQDAPEKPVKKSDHWVDSMRYMVSYIYDMPKEQPKETGWKSWLKERYSEAEPHWMAQG